MTNGLTGSIVERTADEPSTAVFANSCSRANAKPTNAINIRFSVDQKKVCAVSTFICIFSSSAGSDLFQCQPQFQFGYLYKGITKSKLCMKVDNFPSCPGNCYALGGKEALFRFRCVEESRWQELYSNSVPIVLFPYTPPETCFCHAPCSHY